VLTTFGVDESVEALAPGRAAFSRRTRRRPTVVATALLTERDREVLGLVAGL